MGSARQRGEGTRAGLGLSARASGRAESELSAWRESWAAGDALAAERWTAGSGECVCGLGQCEGSWAEQGKKEEGAGWAE